MKRWQLGLVVLVSAALIGIGLYTYQQHTKESAKPTYGYVRMDVAEKTNPLYPQYQQALQDLENLQAQYRAEQQMYAMAAQRQASMAAQAAQQDRLANSLQEEYAAKMALKETQLNGQLLQAYNGFVKEYGSYVPATGPAQLAIVNLQLGLAANIYTSPEEKKEKEEELQRLLEKADPSLQANMQAAEAKIAAAMAPLREKAAAELQDYQATLQKELQQKGDQKQSMASALAAGLDSLPNPVTWQTEWEKRLSMQEAKVQALHEAIAADIRARIPALAEERGLTLVLSQYEAQHHMVDLTDALVASYP